MHRSRRPSAPVQAAIESLSHDGRGVTHIEGKAVFIHGALPGEEVLFSYAKRSRRMDEGAVVEVLKPSPDRVEPKCAHFGLCGGCALQHLAPAAQIRAKQQVLMDAFRHIGKVAPEEILPPLTADTAWGYRTKARLGAKFVVKKGRLLVGFRERASPFLADIERCEVLSPKIGERLPALREMIDGLSLRDQTPQVELAIAENASVLVFRLMAQPTEADIQRLLAFGAAEGFHIYTQTGGPDTISPLPGQEAELTYQLPEFGLELAFLPTDFTQVNVELNRRMVHRAVEMLDPLPDERVLDLFCGLGNFTLPLAQRAQEVVGVEGDPGLVERARANAVRNGIGNAVFQVANLYGPLDGESWPKERFEKVLLDPPRSGAAEVLEPLSRIRPRRIVYISCYPGTLARDAGELVNTYGYRLLSAGVMDMFPHTNHVESIALFEDMGKRRKN